MHCHAQFIRCRDGTKGSAIAALDWKLCCHLLLSCLTVAYTEGGQSMHALITKRLALKGTDETAPRGSQECDAKASNIQYHEQQK